MKNSFRLLPILFAAGLAVATPAHADCADPQNQQEINRCAGNGYAAADAELNSVFKQLVSRIGKNWAPPLRAAQRAWVTFRDAECEFQSMGWEGGSGRGAVQARCLERVTKERTDLLKEMLKCDPENHEGAMECPPKS